METVVFGPGDIDQAHQPDEYLSADRLQPTIDTLGKVIARYCLKAQAT
jgi:acetylornithine deacetylase